MIGVLGGGGVLGAKLERQAAQSGLDTIVFDPKIQFRGDGLPKRPKRTVL